MMPSSGANSIDTARQRIVEAVGTTILYQSVSRLMNDGPTQAPPEQGSVFGQSAGASHGNGLRKLPALPQMRTGVVLHEMLGPLNDGGMAKQPPLYVSCGPTASTVPGSLVSSQIASASEIDPPGQVAVQLMQPPANADTV